MRRSADKRQSPSLIPLCASVVIEQVGLACLEDRIRSIVSRFICHSIGILFRLSTLAHSNAWKINSLIYKTFKLTY